MSTPPPHTHTHKWGQSRWTFCFDAVRGVPSDTPSVGPGHACVPLVGYSHNAELRGCTYNIVFSSKTVPAFKILMVLGALALCSVFQKKGNSQHSFVDPTLWARCPWFISSRHHCNTLVK